MASNVTIMPITLTRVFASIHWAMLQGMRMGCIIDVLMLFACLQCFIMTVRGRFAICKYTTFF